MSDVGTRVVVEERLSAGVGTALSMATAHLLDHQRPRGDWEGEMVWCPIITAQYAIVRHVVGRPLDTSGAARRCAATSR